MPNTLRKSERLDKKKVIEKMFAGGSRSFSVFPLRVVYLPVEELEAPVSILVSVSKRRFKRAVKRNRVKRQIREAYRMNKHGLLAARLTTKATTQPTASTATSVPVMATPETANLSTLSRDAPAMTGMAR